MIELDDVGCYCDCINCPEVVHCDFNFDKKGKFIPIKQGIVKELGSEWVEEKTIDVEDLNSGKKGGLDIAQLID